MLKKSQINEYSDIAWRMTNIIGANSIQGSVQSGKLRATMWLGSESYDMGTKLPTRGLGDANS